MKKSQREKFYMAMSIKEHLMKKKRAFNETTKTFHIQYQPSRNGEFAQFDKDKLQNHTDNITLTAENLDVFLLRSKQELRH